MSSIYLFTSHNWSLLKKASMTERHSSGSPGYSLSIPANPDQKNPSAGDLSKKSSAFWVLRYFSALLLSFGLAEAITLEQEANNSAGTATALTLSSDTPTLARVLYSQGAGTISLSSDEDWWSVSVESGDRLSVYVENLEPNVYFELYDPNEVYQTRRQEEGAGTDDFLSGWTITQTGTYFIRVRHYSGIPNTGEYRISTVVARGAAMETDLNYANDNTAGADLLNLTIDGAQRSGSVVGGVMGMESTNTDEDYYALGILNGGNTVELDLTIPEHSTLTPRLRVVGPSGFITDDDGNAENANFTATLTETGNYYAVVDSTSWVRDEIRYRYQGLANLTEARAAAGASGGRLLQLKEEASQQWSMANFGGLPLWLGLTDEAAEGTWVWDDGTLLSATYENWAANEPNTPSYDYAYRESNGLWYDIYPSINLYTFVETDAPGAPNSGPGPFANYLLSATVTDNVAPVAAAPVGLPVDGGTMSEFLESFTQSFSEDVLGVVSDPQVYLYGGNHYVWLGGNWTWAAAQAEATTLGGYIVSVNDEAEDRFVDGKFGRLTDFWLGLTHSSGTNAMWEDGTAATYTHWNVNEPNSSNSTQAYLENGSGRWRDYHPTSSRPLLVEIEGALDGDGDGIPDGLDPYPTEALNAFDLREAGVDETFDTADDVVYLLAVSGSSPNFTVTLRDGPLPSGSYRYSVNSVVTDSVGNPLILQEQFFTVDLPFDPGAGFVQEGSLNNDHLEYSVEIPLATDGVVGSIQTGLAEGSLSPQNDVDWWRFEVAVGDRLAIHCQGLNGSDTQITIYRPDQSYWINDRRSGANVDAFLSGLVAAQAGTYYLQVQHYNGSWNRPYRLWVTAVTGEAVETDLSYANDNTAGADSLSLTIDGAQRSGSIIGGVMSMESTNFDEDYYALGILNGGNTVELDLTLPEHSTLAPRLRVVGPSGFVTDDDGNADNANFTATLTETGNYYAVVDTTSWVRDEVRYRYEGYLTYTAARAAADAVGGRLLQLQDEATQLWSMETFGTLPLWLGLTDESVEGTWVWDDGSTAGYDNWASTEPNTPSYDYATRDSNGLWYDFYPNGSLYTVVETDAPGAPDSGPGPLANYLLSATVTDNVAPSIILSGVPSDGGTTSNLLTSFTLSSDEPLDSSVMRAQNLQIWEFNQHFYLYTGENLDWSAAQGSATSFGGYLASINGAPEQIFVDETFSQFGDFWVGLTHDQGFNSGIWEDDTNLSFTNWKSGEPNNGASYSQAYLESSTGQWRDYPPTSPRLTVVEIEDVDTDLDGIPDNLDPHPSDPLNAFDLREAGFDGIFDTPDDLVYRLIASGSGSNWTLTLRDGTLPSGLYRFTLTDRIGDTNGNGIAPFQSTFTVAIAGECIMVESPSSNFRRLATPLTPVEDPAGSGYFIARGVGEIASGTDWWRVSLLAGDVVTMAVDTPTSLLNPAIDLYDPAQAYITGDTNCGPGNDALLARRTIATTGEYTIAVNRSGGSGVYFLRVDVARGASIEDDCNYANESRLNADPVVFTPIGNDEGATLAGTVMETSTETDEDYFNLGVITSGKSLFLTTYQPCGSQLNPAVQLRNEDGVIVVPTVISPDGALQFDVTETKQYYVLIFANSGEGAFGQYVVDARIRQNTDFPDLVPMVTSIANVAEAGESIDIEWTVRNDGNTPTAEGTWQDRVYLSRDDQLGDLNDILLGSITHNGDLAIGADYDATGQFTIPPGLQGQTYLIFVADAENKVFEFDGEANNIVVRPLLVSPAPSADLGVTLVTAPAVAVAGAAIDIDWTVLNSGPGKTGNGLQGGTVSSWIDRLVISSNGFLGDGDDVLLAEVPRNEALSQDEDYSQSLSVSLPAGISGLKTIFVVTDFGDAVFEDEDTALNYSTANVNVSLTPFYDLAVTSVSAPMSLTSSEITVLWVGEHTLRTSGQLNATWEDRIWLSPDTHFGNEDDVLLGSTIQNHNLAPSASYNGTARVPLPSLASGTYTIFVEINSDAAVHEHIFKGNNVSAGSLLEVTQPNLVVNAVNNDEGPKLVGDALNVNWTIANVGNVEANGGWTLALDLVEVDSTRRFRLGEAIVSTQLPGNSSESGSDNFLIPEGLPSGNWKIEAFADSRSQVAESSETDNVSLSTQQLAITGSSDFPILQLNFAETTFVEGSSLLGTVLLDEERDRDIVVTLVSSRANLHDELNPVTILAGELSAEFYLISRQNSRIEAPAEIEIRAAAFGYRQANAAVLLLDDDIPFLNINFDRSNVLESDGIVLGRVQRETATRELVRVWLTNDNSSKVSLPQSVVIPAYATEVVFEAELLDDNLVGGNQSATILGEVRGTGGAILSTSNPAVLTVGDDDGPTLTMVAEPSILFEGQTGNISLRRSVGSTGEPLDVTINNLPTGNLVIPSSVQFGPDESQKTVLVSAVESLSLIHI